MLEKLIIDTSKANPLRAAKLDTLLKKKWSEEKNAYRLMSYIKTDK